MIGILLAEKKINVIVPFLEKKLNRFRDRKKRC